MSEWISVKDRLPEFDQTVLIYIPTHSVGYATGIMRQDRIAWPEYAYFPPEKCGNNEITHWMTLPNAPE